MVIAPFCKCASTIDYELSRRHNCLSISEASSEWFMRVQHMQWASNFYDLPNLLYTVQIEIKYPSILVGTFGSNTFMMSYTC